MFRLQNSNGEPVYRKVAVVENFFDIIYNVHVELEGRPGKHAGQKRTYRTVSRTLYSNNFILLSFEIFCGWSLDGTATAFIHLASNKKPLNSIENLPPKCYITLVIQIQNKIGK